MPTPAIGQADVKWYQIDGIDHVSYHVCNVDEEAKILDVLFKFAAKQRIVPHRHHVDYYTLVLQGELRINKPDGELAEVRPVGSYVGTAGGGEPHTEGGGDEDAIVFFSNRGIDGPIYEILDQDHKTLMTFGLQEFKALWQAQDPPRPTKVA